MLINDLIQALTAINEHFNGWHIFNVSKAPCDLSIILKNPLVSLDFVISESLDSEKTKIKLTVDKDKIWWAEDII